MLGAENGQEIRDRRKAVMEQEGSGERLEGMEEAVRLNKFLSDAGVCSRREADRLIEAGRVLVDGAAAINRYFSWSISPRGSCVPRLTRIMRRISWIFFIIQSGSIR